MERAGTRRPALAGIERAVEPTHARREGQTFAGESLLVRYVNFVKLPHTLFALPFALVGVLAASRVSAVTVRDRGCSVVARVHRRALRGDGLQSHRRPRDRRARTRAPRMREMPRGALSVREAWLSVVVRRRALHRAPRGCSTRSACAL